MLPLHQSPLERTIIGSRSVRTGCERTFVQEIRSEVERLSQDGLRPNDIARRLGVAGPTVAYHLRRLVALEGTCASISGQEAEPDDQLSALSYVRTRDQVERLLGEGLSRTAIAKQIGVTKGTVAYHARRLGAPIDERCARRYDWDVIQRFYDEGHTVRECQARFGFSRHTWHAATARGALKPRPKALPLHELLVADRYRSRHNVKLRLLGSGLKESRCESCGLAEWRGGPLPLSLHHINGDPKRPPTREPAVPLRELPQPDGQLLGAQQANGVTVTANVRVRSVVPAAQTDQPVA